ncbi:MAG: hypothetical protein C4521_04260 [Actinobacteria bacterium]|nr:MAG: hypothetical protein C4521_04260 [Actinomycetota bacterium]
MRKYLNAICLMALLTSFAVHISGCLESSERGSDADDGGVGAHLESTSVVITTSGPKPAIPAKPQIPAGVSFAVVSRVIDGDTVELANGRRVRYIGIDTPERGKPYCEEASSRNRRLVEGKRVKLVKDVSETDKYGRLLRYVYVGSTFVNAALVRDGYAMAYTYPPDVKYADYFVWLQGQARTANRGLWGSETVAPTRGSPGEYPYVASKKRDPFHSSDCRWAKETSASNLQRFRTREQAIAAGHRPCKVCDP